MDPRENCRVDKKEDASFEKTIWVSDNRSCIDPCRQHRNIRKPSVKHAFLGANDLQLHDVDYDGHETWKITPMDADIAVNDLKRDQDIVLDL